MSKASGHPLMSPILDEIATHDLLKWVAERIVLRAQTGRPSINVRTPFCLLCKEARRRKEVCKHNDIWRAVGMLSQKT